MPRLERDRELARRRSRKAKIKKLRAKYAASQNDAEKQEILAKARRLSPFIEFETEGE